MRSIITIFSCQHILSMVNFRRFFHQSQKHRPLVISSPARSWTNVKRHWGILLLLGLLAGCAGNPPLETNNQSLSIQGLSKQRAAIVITARNMLGVGYQWGGNNPRTGLDCSGLAELAYHSAGIDIPRTSNEQFHFFPKVRVAKPGDLLFFGHGSTATHVGIYVGRNLMIHAPGSGRTVEIAHVDYPYWQKHFIGSGSLAD